MVQLTDHFSTTSAEHIAAASREPRKPARQLQTCCMGSFFMLGGKVIAKIRLPFNGRHFLLTVVASQHT